MLCTLWCGVSEEAADTEPAWKGAGQEVGLQIWRIVVSIIIHASYPHVSCCLSSTSSLVSYFDYYFILNSHTVVNISLSASLSEVLVKYG